MPAESRILHLKNVAFELVFVLTSDNTWIGHLGVLAILVDYVQMLSFAFGPTLNWGCAIVVHRSALMQIL